MKTREEVLSDVILADDTEDAQIVALEAMRQFAKQVVESYRDELLKDLPECISTAYALKYKHKIGQYILNFDLDQFIK